LKLGITGIHDAGLDGFGVKTYQEALKKGILTLRVYLILNDNLVESISKLGISSGFGNEKLKIGSIKLFIDGSIGARTAALSRPYNDSPSTKGLLMASKTELENKIKTIHNLGFQVAVHAIGDYGIQIALDSLTSSLTENPRENHRHRIEHCELPNIDQIRSISSLSLILSMQPNFVGNWSGPEGLYHLRLGLERLKTNNPLRLILDNKIHLAFGSDCMPFNPFYGIWSAINHPIKENRITLIEAIKAYTSEAAYSSFEDKIKGSIEPGKLADVVVVDRDLTRIPIKEIKRATALITIVGGRICHYKENDSTSL
jgi:predicted amidohydrolase YtcJ